MAVATLVSRITGFLRTLALVSALGLGTHLLDTYTAANVTPNAVYELVMGGAAASVLVPLLVRVTADEDVDAELFTQRLLSLVLYGLSAVVLVTIVAAPLIVELTVPGFGAAQRELAVDFTRIFLPQILFYGISAALAAILNARGRFAAPMWAPVANNLVVIATAGTFLLAGGTGRMETLTQGQTLLLSIGTSAGVGAQMVVLAVVTRRAGFPLRLRADPRGIAVRRIAAMAGWTVASVTAAQAALIVVNRLASQAGPGAVSVFSNAYTLFQLPYAVVAVTVITGMLPRMSRAATERDLSQVTADLSRSLRLTGVVLVPVAAALVVLGPRLTTLLFAHGNASPGAAHLTGVVLAAYAPALVPFAGYQIMLRVHYALGDTRTPALISVAVSAALLVASLVAARLHPGADMVVALAGCTAVAYALGLVITAQSLRRRIGRIDGRRLLRSHARMLVAAGVAGLAAAVVASGLGPAVGTGPGGSLAVVCAATLTGACLYALAARLLRIGELTALTAGLPWTFRSL
ncbi:murein biosynthesis integral membrane protein MurJ [Nonomuraea sp. SMC257]|uniref:Murein biosynthesis integral membrane protein MurJ n=2 Tax=Nonomuraea montanisoli TaxID=2741721 RepID=A0A7Y6ICK0_9ACTN|nr:murein biosynthesis integral membrane protein MurJ [Nonomuraea montanisoli]